MHLVFRTVAFMLNYNHHQSKNLKQILFTCSSFSYSDLKSEVFHSRFRFLIQVSYLMRAILISITKNQSVIIMLDFKYHFYSIFLFNSLIASYGWFPSLTARLFQLFLFQISFFLTQCCSSSFLSLILYYSLHSSV